MQWRDVSQLLTNLQISIDFIWIYKNGEMSEILRGSVINSFCNQCLCRSMESFFFWMFRCICRVFKVQHACYFVENYLVYLHTKCLKNFALCQQIQIDDGLLEGWSKWTPLILSTDTNTRGDDDSRYALLWFHTVRREPGMLQRCICCYCHHQQNRCTWNSAIIPHKSPLIKYLS